MIRRCAAAVVLVLPAIAPAIAQEPPPYLDNRSDAGALIRSLYNAINRKEFSRAWSYYGEMKPAASLDAFSDGYKDTDHVDVKVGSVSSEGAAGSVFYNIPVAIEAFDAAGASKIFAGCYSARLANPEIQAGDFQPMHIEKGSLSLSDQPLDTALPPKCGDGEQQMASDPIIEQAKAAYAVLNGQTCNQANAATGLPDEEPQSFEIRFRSKDQPESEPEHVARLISFQCAGGAYNFSTVYYLHDELEGLRQVEFPVPELDVKYESEAEDAKAQSVTVTGFFGQRALMNSEYEPASQSVTAFDKWRGIGDASSSGTWTFRDGNFVLVKYDVDASYDGEINPETVVDYESAP